MRGKLVEPCLAPARVPPGWKRQSQRCPDCVSERLVCPGISTSPWFTASCCRDGSLAVTQPLWVRPTAEESTSCGGAHPVSAGNAHTLIKIAANEKERSCPVACASSPMLLSRDHFSKTGVRVGSVVVDQSWSQWVSKLLPWLKVGSLEGIIGNFVYPAAEKGIWPTTGALRLDVLTSFQTRHKGGNIDRVQVLCTLQGIQIRRRSHHSVVCPLRNKVETLVIRAVVLLTNRLQIQQFTNA